jgi:uncharacterized RDD family membrane protein YckC
MQWKLFRISRFGFRICGFIIIPMLYQVISTEKVPLDYRVAGLGSRFVAWLIDMAIIIGLVYVAVIVAAAWEIAREGFGVAVALVATFVVQWGYFVLFEWLWHGQTPGKRAIGIRVIDLEGTGISFGQAAVRNVLRVVDGLPLLIPDIVPVLYGVGFLVAAGNSHQRRLGDLAAGTLVVYVESSTAPLLALQQALTGEAHPTLFLRQRLEQLTRSQKQTLLDLCLRRDQLRVRERARLFAAVTEYFRQHLELAPTAHQSPEKFVLQLAAALTQDVTRLP